MNLPNDNWLIVVDPKSRKGARKTKKGLRHKNLFLTYPKCNLSLKDARMQLSLIFSNKGVEIESYAMRREQHIDKRYHLHCFFSLNKEFSDASMAKLDLFDLNDEKYHGNYQAVRRKHNVIEYCLKSLEFIASEDIISNYFAGKYPEAVINQCWQFAQIGQAKRAIQLYARCMPVKKRLQVASVEKSFYKLAKLFEAQEDNALFRIDEFNQHLGIIAGTTELSTKCMWIYGPPGTNKTQYTLALLEQVYQYAVLFVDNINVLDEFEPTIHQVIVFDDIDMSKLRRESLISLIDVDIKRTAKILYKTVTLPRGTHRIIVANFHPEKLWKKWDAEHIKSIERRLNIVKVEAKLQKMKHPTRIEE